MHPDPFGRVLAAPKPEPEIMNFKNPFRIRDSVGMEGLNARRDVAKVESLLGRAGALDLSETDGVTGFFGARADEAVRRFQKDRGLRVDGLITPQGPTLRTLVAEEGPSKPPTTLPAPPLPVGTEPQPGPTPDPRRENFKRIARRLLEMQKTGIDPRNVPLAAAGTDAGDGGTGEGEGKPPSTTKPTPSPEKETDRQAEILGKLLEVIDELKKSPDPQAGDIDTAGPGGDAQGETPSRSNDRQPGPSKTGKQGQQDKKDLILDRLRDLLEAQLEKDAKKEIPEILTEKKRLMKKAKQQPKQPDRPIRNSRPGGGGGGGGGGPFRIPRKGFRDPFELLDGLFNLLK